MPGPSSGLSPLDCELLTLAMPAHATPMFTLTDSASGPAILGLERASPLECALTKNAPASLLESALTKLLDLKSFRFHTYKKHPGGSPLFFFLYFLYVLYLLYLWRTAYWPEGVGRVARAR